MPPSPTTVTAFARKLATTDLAFAPKPTAAILPILTAASLGHRQSWLRPSIEEALRDLPAKPPRIPPQPRNPLDDAVSYPRRLALGQLKEAFVKAAIMIGVPRSIRLLVEMQEFLDADDLGQPFVRQALEAPGCTVSDLGENGLAGLRTMCEYSLGDIFSNLDNTGLEDLRAPGPLLLAREKKQTDPTFLQVSCHNT